ncbi:hypothetical protein B0T17DRAFT_520381 [Bombardia bombarda]|uniref:Uncharacterized protein n=1 Tax=Bombardia bombarda TaxID=252184 RepID=A0AA39XPD6_9PEZI|nr:hypothetical protein B0T17DRAFT_520381 [Bombardia bombarda]
MDRCAGGVVIGSLLGFVSFEGTMRLHSPAGYVPVAGILFLSCRTTYSLSIVYLILSQHLLSGCFIQFSHCVD